MVEKIRSDKLLKTLLKLIIKQDAFALCPDCKKHLSIFEVYNENCSFCGEIYFDDIYIIKNNAKDDETEEE